jgi:hypothetical protein
MPTWRRIDALVFAALTGCAHQPQTLKPRDLIGISPASGAVAAKLVPDPNSPELKLGPGEEYVAPQLSTSNRPPKYPADLLPLDLPRHSASVRVTFDENGRPIDVIASPIGEITHDQYESAFMAAVEEAVRRWHCYPARIRKFRDGPDNDGDGKPDYRILSAQRILKTFFDVTFTFEVVDGHPVVKGQ